MLHWKRSASRRNVLSARIHSSVRSVRIVCNEVRRRTDKQRALTKARRELRRPTVALRPISTSDEDDRREVQHRTEQSDRPPVDSICLEETFFSEKE
jgi:hypothetical protein